MNRPFTCMGIHTYNNKKPRTIFGISQARSSAVGVGLDVIMEADYLAGGWLAANFATERV